MGHVYGYGGGNSKGDAYHDSEDEDDEDGEISLKFGINSVHRVCSLHVCIYIYVCVCVCVFVFVFVCVCVSSAIHIALP